MKCVKTVPISVGVVGTVVEQCFIMMIVFTMPTVEQCVLNVPCPVSTLFTCFLLFAITVSSTV